LRCFVSAADGTHEQAQPPFPQQREISAWTLGAGGEAKAEGQRQDHAPQAAQDQPLDAAGGREFLNNPLGGITSISASSLTRSPSITTLYIRAASQAPNGSTTASTTSLTSLFLDLLDANGTTVLGTTSIDSLTSIDGARNYITVDGVTGNFRVRGDATLSWTGTRPERSAMSWQIKAAYKTAEVPGPLPVLGGMAAFGWSRRLRRRLRQIPSSVSA
jgi:hypothetical protein